MLSENLKKIDVKNSTIVAATKYVTDKEIRHLYHLGIKNMGENRVQSFLEKYEKLRDIDIIWHFIGHLQTNKVKSVINKIDYLHSLDSIRLAEKINLFSNKKIKCFIEINSGEETKCGIEYSEVVEFLEKIKKYPKIEIIGFMTMAPNTDDEETIKKTFKKLEELKNRINPNFKLSMGMSNDYKIAIECGATHIRLGSILWKGVLL